MIRRAFVVGAVIATCGCGGEAPPFDELPLRDSLLADSRALAALPREARARLAARFEEERTSPTSPFDVQGTTGAETATRAIDDARERQGLDALVAYSIAGSRAVAYTDVVAEGERPARSVVVEGEVPRDTEAMELRALEGRAGHIVEALRESSHASHVVRVNGWPTGVAVIGDTVYVNGAWLTALAPDLGGAVVDPYTPIPQGTTPVPGVFVNQGGASDAGTRRDASTTPTPGPSTSTSPSSGCGCSSCGCSSCDCSSCTGSSCDHAFDGCSKIDSGSSSSSGRSCGSGSGSACGSGSGGRTCSTAPPARTAWGVSRLVAMLAPLAGLLALSRRRR
jgi:hypothetical protein